MDFQKELTHKTEQINHYLEELFVMPELPQKQVFEAMAYSVKAGGKRIRPVLALACCEAAGGKAEEALPYAAAMECVHTYSLIHDDLPAMDNDDYRRGMLTNHKKFGEATAILAGDALLNYAFEITMFAPGDAQKKVEIAKILSSASGAYGMIGGQMVDMLLEGKEADLETLKYMYRLKTGALIKASCAIGAVAAGAKRELFDAYAGNLGLAFQIKDDILDMTGDAALLGKSIGSDEKNHKSTFATLCGLDEAQRTLEEATELAIDAVQPFGEKGNFLRELAFYLLKREL